MSALNEGSVAGRYPLHVRDHGVGKGSCVSRNEPRNEVVGGRTQPGTKRERGRVDPCWTPDVPCSRRARSRGAGRAVVTGTRDVRA